jgi:hypothetical protein
MSQSKERGRPGQDEPGRFYGRETKAPEVALTIARPRVYAPTDEIAREVAGPDAVAVLDFKAVLPVELVARLKRTVTGLRALDVQLCGVPVDASRIVEMNLENVVSSIEEVYNEGQPFEDVGPVKVPRNPIPRMKAR